MLFTVYTAAFAETVDKQPGFDGVWVINDKLSDDTDKQVEKAIKAGGGRIKHGGKKGKYRYKGGPKEQELYDHLAYDKVLQFHHNETEFHLLYEEGFTRVFYTDNRGRSVSARGLSSGHGQDYSFAGWEGDKLLVESRPRDGGKTNETYSLEAGGAQLRVELHLEPLSFGAPINIIRIYDRRKDPDLTPDNSE